MLTAKINIVQYNTGLAIIHSDIESTIMSLKEGRIRESEAGYAENSLSNWPTQRVDDESGSDIYGMRTLARLNNTTVTH